MVRHKGNRMMRLLKHTSEHHQTSSLAAAVALGLFAGVLPKTNLLAALAYLLVILLPIHNLLALLVSLVVAVSVHQGAVQCDAITGKVGNWLLDNPQLQSMWFALDSLPIVPWMCLHNTVVLGSLVVAVCLVGPTYLVAFRAFERLQYGRHVNRPVQGYAAVPQAKPAEPVVQPAPAHRVSRYPEPNTDAPDSPPPEPARLSAAIIPPPNLFKHYRPSKQPPVTIADMPDEEAFEPVQAVTPIINAWHMGQEPNHASATHLAGQHPLRTAHAIAAHANPGVASNASVPSRLSTNDHDSANSVEDQPSEAETKLRNALDARNHPASVLDSLELAHSASEVLAWVDDLLDECLAEESLTLATAPINSLRSADDLPYELTTETDVVPASPDFEEQWVVETTIEIVRWADESIPAGNGQSNVDFDMDDALPSGGPSNASVNSSNQPSESSHTMFASQATNDWQATGAGLSQLEAILSMKDAVDANSSTGQSADAKGSTSNPFHRVGEARLSSRTERSTGNDNRLTAGFQQLVMADNDESTAQRATLPIEPMRGECLGYLLGHLRQVREGKGS